MFEYNITDQTEHSRVLAAMENRIGSGLFFVATIFSGLLAGFFYTWSFTIMHSLDLIDDSTATTAMISINGNIRNGWFAAIFFGTPVLVFLSFILSLRTTRRSVSLLVFMALAFALATAIITFSIHLPLNESLTKALSWGQYSVNWVQWNHARMLTSLLAFISMVCVVRSLSVR